MKFGKGMADKGGRAMKNRTPDKMGRAMVKKFSMGGAMGKGAREAAQRAAAARDAGAASAAAAAAGRGAQRGMPANNPRFTVEEIGDFSGPRMRKGGMAYSKGGKAKSGGSYRKAADGVAHKGKTKGKMVKMAYGGKC
jgi:hypothetical protein